MAGVDDLVTVQKNGVVAVNTLVETLDNFQQIYASFVGSKSSVGLDANELIFSGSGRLVNVSVITAAAGGTIHDAATVVDATTNNAIFVIPNATGITSVNFPVANGLVIKPASTSVISISYTEDE